MGILAGIYIKAELQNCSSSLIIPQSWLVAGETKGAENAPDSLECYLWIFVPRKLQ